MTLNLTYRPFVYYRCNVSFGDMLHSTHGIDYTQNMVVYACPRTNRMLCENGGNCYTGAHHDDGYFFINFRRIHAGRRWYEGEWSFSKLKVNSRP